MTEEANGEVDPDGGVDADDQVSEVPENDGEIQVRPDLLLGEEFVHEVEGKRDEEAEEIGDADPFVTSTNGEHFRGHRPGDSGTVQTLDVDPRPNGGSFNGQESWKLVGDDTVRHVS